MSHIVSITTQVKDAVAVRAACQRLNVPVPTVDTARLYGGDISGLLVQLPGWKYPVAIDTATGSVSYDNYGGAWGQTDQLDRLFQAYACEKAKLEARRRGLAVTEHVLHDGRIRLQIAEHG